MNKNGGEYHLRKEFRRDQLDKIWLELSLALICEHIDPIKNNEICGIRIVDRSKSRKPLYRLEVWYNTKNTIEAIRDKLECVLDQRYDWEVKTRAPKN